MAVKYALYLEPEVYANRAELPGYVRQDIRARIAALATTPRPSNSKELQLAGDAVPAGVEIRRLRVGYWRIIYCIHDSEQWVWVLAIRRRPPYDYADLAELIDRIT
jgi:mRNA interferase RelE/StbE